MDHDLVTGGAGFIGSHIADRLASDGRRVRILDDFSTGSRETARRLCERHGSKIEVLEGDVRDPAACSRAVAGCRAVFHQAALASVQRSVADPLASHEVNATGTLRLLQASREAGVERFVCAGSSSVYGDTPTLPKVEDMPPSPRSPYALSKLVAEEFTRLFHEIYGLSTATLRYFNVFGPRQDPNSPYAAVIPLFIKALRAGESPVIYGDGLQSRDFTYVDNVVEANLAAAQRIEACGPFNIGCGDRATLLQLLETLGEVLGSHPEPRFDPPRPGDVKHSLADISRARGLLGYDPKVDLPEGLRRTVASRDV